MLSEAEFIRTSACITYKPNSYPQNDHKTAVCFGMARGGTSAVAGLIQELGFFMGDNLENNYEDPDFIQKDSNYLTQVISERNERHGNWGWKFPDAGAYLPFVFDSLRNPLFIVVFRDAVAITKAHARFYLKDTQHVLDEYVIAFMQNTLVTRRLGAPALFISYEKLVAYPETGINQLAEFLAVPKPSEEHMAKLVDFLRPTGYKHL